MFNVFMVKFVYSVFIGILLATCIGVGISAFYTAPKPPEYPITLSRPDTAEDLTPQDKEEHRIYQEKMKEYDRQIAPYSRNVALIAVGLSIAVLVISLTMLSSIQMIADGLLLGSVFALIYGIIRSFGSGEQKFMFAIVTFGLIVAIFLGYIKFIKPASKASK